MNIFNISPLDGRYYEKTKELQEIFSEYGLQKYRVEIEIKYFIFFLENIFKLNMTEKNKLLLNNLYIHFSKEDAFKIKEIESTTNHDVKSIEYFIKLILSETDFDVYKEYVHFGLTSQDINSVSYVLQIKYYVEKIFIPEVTKLINVLNNTIEKSKNIVMLGFTHGQPASTTTMSKELKVFVEKIKYHLASLSQIKYYSKFGGATGNLNAHYVTFPNINWEMEMSNFLKTSFDLTRHQYTTQIDNYDMYTIIFDSIRRIQTVLIDLCQDIWLYIYNDYFILEKPDREIGSSTMPHKINPIDFENAEGNFLLSNNILQFLSNKLPVSRLQRDLTDSTLLRNLGVTFGYGLVGLKSTGNGLNKLKINKKKIEKDLGNNWCIILEGIQSILKRDGFSNSYELVKTFADNNKNPTKDDIDKFIDSLDLSNNISDELKRITPFNYCGNLLS